ncbi:MAG: chemotaxis protein CheW [Rhodothermaceae bacterium]
MQEIITEKDIEIKNKVQFCTFWISGRLYGVDILDIKEISTEVIITPIFHAPEEVRGYVNIRGQIYLVIDLPLFLGHQMADITAESRIVIFKDNVGELFGVLVDKIGDVVEVSEQDIEEVQRWSENSDAEINSKIDRVTKGVSKLKDNILVILNSEIFLPEIEKLLSKQS